MQTPAQLDFRGVAATPQLEAMIAEHIAELEDRYSRIAACHVVVRGPGERHQHGGLYAISIALALPDGHDLNIGRTPPRDTRNADLIFAINDAFRRARRRLQDHSRRRAGQVKLHEGQPVGTVARIDPTRQFGFLTAADGHEVYFHRSSVLGNLFDKLKCGSHVTFQEETGLKGPQASTVRLIAGHALRI